MNSELYEATGVWGTGGVTKGARLQVEARDCAAG